MSAGLLTSRNTKLDLLKTYLASHTEYNKLTYKNYRYRNLFQKTLRAAKKNHIEETLLKNLKNQ